MELKKVVRNKNTLYALIDQRSKILKKAAVIQEKIDRERKDNGRPKAYEANHYNAGAYTFDDLEREHPDIKLKYRVPYDYGHKEE